MAVACFMSFTISFISPFALFNVFRIWITVVHIGSMRELVSYLFQLAGVYPSLWGLYVFVALCPFVVLSVALCPDSGPFVKASKLEKEYRQMSGKNLSKRKHN